LASIAKLEAPSLFSVAYDDANFRQKIQESHGQPAPVVTQELLYGECV
jgi:hypothetical protein